MAANEPTERKWALEALRESEERFRSFFDNAPIGKSMTAPDGQLLRVNATLANMLGYTTEELSTMSFASITHPDDLDESRECVRSLIAGERNNWAMEKRYIAKDGRHIWTYVTTRLERNANGQPLFFLTHVQDITERKRAEDALRESEDRYRDLVEHSQELICTHDLEGRILSLNPWAAKILDRPIEALVQMNIQDILAPETRELFGAYINDLKEHGFSNGFMIIQTFKGERRIWEYQNTLRTEGVAAPIVRGMAQDITERKRAENALRESEGRFRTLFEGSRDAIMVLEPPSWLFTSGNPSAVQMFGAKSEEEFTSNEPWRLSPEFQPDGRPSSDKAKEMIETAMRDGSHFFEWTHKRIGGEEFPATVLLTRIQTNGNAFLQATVRDITDQKKAEDDRENLQEQLVQAQKMEAVGRLAGGVAHDFNNLLTAIMGNAEFLLMNLNDPENIREGAKDIQEASERAAALTKQLLAFSRKQILKPEIVDLNELITEMKKMLGRLVREDIQLVTSLRPELWRIKVDPGQMEQVLMNLVVNSNDAMPDGGKLNIETSNVHLDSEYAINHDVKLEPGDYVMIAVADTGHGMDRETMDHIFEPFFTTKEKGKGTGLGLATAYGIVKQSNGFIWVYSEPGQGTTFKIYLPREASQTVTQKTRKEPIKLDKLRNTETILLVEDNEIVRDMARKALEFYGFNVLDASDGDDALLAGYDYNAPIHLLVTDVVMPGMSGRRVAELLKARRPDMKVLYMSGYTDNAIVHHGVLDSGVAFIGKPFSPEDLARKARETLDAK